MSIHVQTKDGTFRVPVGLFPNNEPVVPWDLGNIGNIHSIIIRQNSLQEFVTGMFLVDALRNDGHTLTHLTLPMVPGSRQDRQQYEVGANKLFTLKSVANMINDRNFSLVQVFDPHSNVTPTLIDKCRVISAQDIIEFGINTEQIELADYHYVVAPDAGAVDRAGAVAAMLDVPLIQAQKKRDPSSGRITYYEVPPVELDSLVLVVDDICDGGATFNNLAKAMPGAILDLYVTHGLFTKGYKELKSNYDHIFTTNTTPVVENIDFVSVIDITNGGLDEQPHPVV
jgi:ribose-phosphate pyrophosphokinase